MAPTPQHRTPGPPLRALSLVGPTAAGKSDLALALARRLGNVELVSVDSMCVYRGMDIGTAKPPAAVRAEVPYHLLDLVDPSEEFTVQQFQAAAREALAGIAARAHRAVLVGGTGLYLRAVVDDLEFPGRFPEVAAGLAAELDAAGPPGSDAERAALAALHRRLGESDPVAAARVEPTNRRRILRAMEVTVGTGRRFSDFGPGLGMYAPSIVLLAGIPLAPEVRERRIEERFRAMLDAGLLDEVRALAGGARALSRTARQALGYRELLAHVEDGLPLDLAVDEAIRRTRSFARRQWAWFRRDPRIVWLDPAGDMLGELASLVGGAPAPADRPTRSPDGPAPADRQSPPAGSPHRRPVGPGGGTMEGVADLRLTKHHGAGNDFLVLVDMDGRIGLGDKVVRALCDRHLGIGADGLIRVLAGPAGIDLTMELRNADGSSAEMSGNGIRCLAQAAVDARVVRPPSFTVATGAGVRTVEYRVGDRPGWAEASVGMGKILLGAPRPGLLAGWQAREADAGNPHVVVLPEGPPAGHGAAVAPDLAALDLATLGPAIEAGYPGGVNVEFVAAGAVPDELTLRVWERGVGETLACGTGSCAAAAVAHDLGVTGPVVRVRNPGGTLTVHLVAGEATLSGPTCKVAEITLDPRYLTAPGLTAPGAVDR